MSDLGPADELARETALDVTRSFIVQAPAGSGKTEVLVRRFLALLASVQSPESVLAITFTRKAAAEMRGRVLRALRAASGQVADSEGMHARTIELAKAAQANDHRCGWDLIGNPGRLRVQTIDSLNFSLARRLPVLSGLGCGVRVDEDPRELYREAAERLLEHLVDGDSPHSGAVATLLSHLDNRVPRFVDLVVEMLARRDAWGRWLPEVTGDAGGAERLRAALEAARAEIVEAHLEALAEAARDFLLTDAATVAREAAANLAAADAESPLCAWRAHRDTPRGTAEDLPLWLGLATLLLTQSGTPRKKFDRNIGMPPGEQGAALKNRARSLTLQLETNVELVERLQALRTLPEPRYDDGEWRALQAQLAVLRLAAAELEVVFSQRRVADYARIAAAAVQSLGTPEQPTDTALALDARLCHVLVDEFQDTSEAQVRLLAALTAGWQPGDGRTLFLVGDPMQSIYRFRNAEVGLFLDVRDHGLGEVRLEFLRLSVNFRSTVPVVDWVNRCFTQAMPPRDDEISGAVSYSAGTAATDAGTDGGVCVHPLFRSSREREASDVADVVEKRLAENSNADIAILVQGRSHLLGIVSELARRGVSFQATDIDPLGQRPLVLDLLALTRAIAHRADRPAWLAVLRAPWCGLTLADLHALCGDDREATLPELLQDSFRIGKLESAARARVERAWSVLQRTPHELRHFGLRDAVERAWVALGGPATAATLRDLEEAQAYFDQLAELERGARGPAELSRLQDALTELYAPSRSDNAIRVQLMTVHKAKGLQFDTVIVPGLERKLRGDDKRLVQWALVPRGARSALVAAPVATTGAEQSRLYRWLEQLEADKLGQERRRLLYVAATRARRWLHLFGSCALKESAGARPDIIRPTSATALGMLWPTLRTDFERRLEHVGMVQGEGRASVPRHAPLRRLPDSWRLPAIREPHLPSSNRQRASSQATVEFDWATETARHVGTVVHRELMRLAGIGAHEGLEDEVAQRRWHDELTELGVPADRRSDAVERVRTAVRRTLADERGRWLLDPRHASARSEFEITGLVDGEVTSVVVDRTFVDAEGTRWIVDYKTSRHEGAGLDAFLDSEQARYRPQLERYATLMRRLGPEPVRLGLYFPLLSAWRSWS